MSTNGTEPLASIVITTYNRREALAETLAALGDQTAPADTYEIVVVDDGSSDGTFECVSAVDLRCHVRVLRNAFNRGISTSRNLAIANAKGRYFIFVSDDLLVEPDFIETHLQTLRRYPGCWVVGGFRQHPALRATPFGRYLEALEDRFTEARKALQIDNDLWELSWPTARNLSLPACDLEKTGVFDERFRMSCEDQDLAHRARDAGIRFLYNEAIGCLHNDQVADPIRYARAQRPRTRDTVLFCAKYPEIHGDAPVARVNGPWSWRDGPALGTKKWVKSLLARDAVLTALEHVVLLCERAGMPDFSLQRLYRVLIGLNMFRGWREGLSELGAGQGRKP